MPTIEENFCRLCHSTANRHALTLTGMPRENHRLLRENEVDRDAAVELRIYRCAECGFVNLPLPVLQDGYYEEYVNAPSNSRQMQLFLKEQAQHFVEHFGLSGKRVLEVGSGDGGFLRQLAEAGAIATGIEPSSAQCGLAQAQGLTVLQGYLDPERPLAEGPFDAFATRQVFEHVEDMRAFLAAIKAQLKPNAVGLVEVPNLDLLLEQDRFYDFIPEHVNYFGKSTLRLALEISGFEVIEVRPVQGDEALRALVRLPVRASLDRLGLRVRSLKQQVSDFIEKHGRAGTRVAVWGAGGKGLSMLAVTDLSRVDLLVDSDANKHGKYTPVSHLRVWPPEALLSHSIDVVVVMAPAYKREIADELRTRLGFQGVIGVVNESSVDEYT